MGVREMNYLLIEHLPSLLSAFRTGMEELAVLRPALKVTGTIIEPDTVLEKQIPELLRNGDLGLVCINLNFPLPPFPEFKTPIALLKYTKTHFPNIKVMATLQNTSVFNIRDLILKTDPDSIVEVTDADKENIVRAFLETLETGIFYSKTVLQLLRMYSTHQALITDPDYQLLHELSLGTKNIELPRKLFLSATTINRRKNKLKEFFDVSGQSDMYLIQKARLLKYI